MKPVKSSLPIKWDAADSVSSPQGYPTLTKAPGHLLHVAKPHLWELGAPFTSLEQAAVAEAGRAVSHFLGTGEGVSITLELMEEGDYEVDTDYDYEKPDDAHACRLYARNDLAAPLACALVGSPLPLASRVLNYKLAAQFLAPHYTTEKGLQQAVEACWEDALSTIGGPRAFRSVAALAHRLVQQRFVDEMPADCYSRDDQLMPELIAAAARVADGFFAAKLEIAAAVADMLANAETIRVFADKPQTGPTMDDLQNALDDLESAGIVRKTGEFRKGQPVYVLTEFGRTFRDEHPGDDVGAAVEALLRKRAPPTLN